MNVQHIKLNIIPGGVLPVVHVSQYDHNAGGLVFDIYNGGELYELPEGTTASIEGTKPDEYGFLYPAAGVSGHSVTIDIVEQMTVVPGKVICELRLAHQQDNVGTINFILAVEPAGLSDDTEVSETDIPLLREAIEAGQQALQSAEQAELSADKAEEEADRAEEAADNLTAIRTTVPAEVITVDDAKATALQQFKANLAPVQDLGGYSGPWPAGGWKNLLPTTGTTTTNHGVTYTVNADGSVTITGESDTTANNYFNAGTVTLPAGDYILNGINGGSSPSYRFRLASGSWGGTVIAQAYDGDVSFTLAEETTVYLRIYVGAAAGEMNMTVYPMIRKATEADDSWAPYANICPISGTTGPITVTRMGKNLIDDSIKTVQSASTVVVGQTSTSAYSIFLKAGTYTVSFESAKAPGIYYRLSTETSGSHNVISYGNKRGTFTLSEDAHLRIWAYLSGGIVPADITWFQIEAGTEATEYQAYSRNTYTVTIPSEAGTVYGGTLTVNSDGSGQLTVDRGCFTADEFLNHSKGSATSINEYFFRIRAGQEPAVTTLANTDLICSHAVNWNKGGGYSVRCRMGSGQSRIVFPLGMMSTLQEFDTWLSEQATAGTPLQFSYILATPTTYALSAAQVVQMLAGDNTIWTDAPGTNEITYITQSPLSDITEELDELQVDVAEMQPVVAGLQTNAVRKSDIVQTGTVTTAGQYVVDARQLNPDLSGTIAKRITDLETGAASAVTTADITRATNITATGTKVVDAYELNASKTGTLAKKISDAATAASAAQTTANTANTAAGNANTALGGFSFGYTSDNKPGFKAPGADTVVPFNSTSNLTIADEIITYRVTSSVDGYTTTRTVQGEIVAAGIIGLSSSDGARNGNPTCTFSGNTMTYHSGYTYSATVTATVRIWYIPT